MSEADSPNKEPVSAPIESVIETIAAIDSTTSDVPASAQADDAGWETVDFPGAMSVDAIPHAQTKNALVEGVVRPISPGVIHYSDATISPMTASLRANPTDSSEAVTSLEQQLQQENAALRDRLNQVEQDLVQQQIEWQLEAACVADQASGNTLNDVDAIAQTQPMAAGSVAAAQIRLNQLFEELELSHQATKRQQILVGTLTEQLASSQERIAQLERDCALTQQRHNEQVQQVMQAETTCRDLRMRLHRQQQQTLQFKAALEKCLEMPTSNSQSHLIPDFSFDDSVASASSDLLSPKNKPVKPWSASAATTHDASDSSELSVPRPLFKLLNQDLTVQSNEAESDAWQSSEAIAEQLPGGRAIPLNPDDPQVIDLMRLIFPETPELSSQIVYAPQDEPIFDLNPFRDTAPSVSSASTNQPEAALSSSHSTTDPLWHDLEQLIDPSLAVSDIVPDRSSDIAPVTESHVTESHVAEIDADVAQPIAPQSLLASNASIQPLFDTPATVETAAEPLSVDPLPVETLPVEKAVVSTPRLLNAWTWRDNLTDLSKAKRSADSAIATQSPSEFLALSAAQKQPANASTLVAHSPVALTAPPSPIVYPHRSTKKLTSLAAVDLPTFPKR